MANKLQSLITLYNNRKNFFNNHPDLYRTMKDSLGKEQHVGTKIKISITEENGGLNETEIILSEADLPFMNALANILKE